MKRNESLKQLLKAAGHAPKMSRRTFAQILGASATLTSLSGCLGREPRVGRDGVPLD